MKLPSKQEILNSIGVYVLAVECFRALKQAFVIADYQLNKRNSSVNQIVGCFNKYGAKGDVMFLCGETTYAKRDFLDPQKWSVYSLEKHPLAITPSMKGRTCKSLIAHCDLQEAFRLVKENEFSVLENRNFIKGRWVKEVSSGRGDPYVDLKQIKPIDNKSYWRNLEQKLDFVKA